MVGVLVLKWNQAALVLARLVVQRSIILIEIRNFSFRFLMTSAQKWHLSLLFRKIQILQIIINVLDLYLALVLVFL